MQYLIRKSKLQGTITIPPSKSHSLRAILFGALGNGTTTIRHYLPSPDAQAMIEACRLFGAKVSAVNDTLQIRGLDGKIAFSEDVINAGNSGIVLRFCAAIGANAPRPVVITGDHSIRHQRPMQPLLDGLCQLGVQVSSMRGDGYAPVIVQGPIKSGKATINGEDSQPVSALLIGAAFAEGPTWLHVKNPGEKPWVALTLDWFKKLGIACENDSYESYSLKGGSSYSGFEYTVPGDFSSAAFPIAAALITESEITLQNIDMSDCQGDKKLLEIFEQMGAVFEVDSEKNTLTVKKGGKLQGICVDINGCIDAITILAVVACYAEGQTCIQNAAIARHKECNRIRCIAQELQKMGAEIAETEDGLTISGGPLIGSALFSHHDHRMCMSLAVAALGAEGETTLSSVDCVAKTFPTFKEDFNRLGAEIIGDLKNGQQ